MTPREENARRAARRRFEARNLINKYKKTHPCKDCDNKFHPCQLDFFRPQGGSAQTISRRLLRSLAVIMRDMEAADLVCANCGRLRTYHAQRALRSEPT